MARHEPPDHSLGDEKTLGGYMAVHARPAAFEGADGRSYTVAIETDETGERARPVGGYLLFVRWGGEQPEVTGHIESPFLAWGASADEVTQAVGALSLHEVKLQLDLLLAGNAPPTRPWWDAMREEGTEHES
ncbi:MAG: hypothetical protein M3Y30_10895 [Gemmatimonadota bacterium]|nr:hypothetical protein [Gemmatimonadota bacterium]